MRLARLKWIALMVACAVVSYAISHYRSNTVRERLSSARVYWTADRAFITVTTAAEVRSEGLVAQAVRIVGGWAKIASTAPTVRVGQAHIFTLQNGHWEHQRFSPLSSPIEMPLWPFNGHLYTWDARQIVREWDGHALIAVSAERSIDLHRAFPHDVNNYVAAGTGASRQPYDVVQDVISRQEWHAYQNIAQLPDGKKVTFPVGDKVYELAVKRVGDDTTLTVSEGGRVVPVWQAQPSPRKTSAAEFAAYRYSARLSPCASSTRNLWFELLTPILILIVVWSLFLRPALLQTAPATVEFEDANVDDYPELNRQRWDELCSKVEALGFVQVRDFRLRSMMGYRNIARLYVHPSSKCYANLFQIFASSAPKQIVFGFMSYLGEDWSVGHGDSKPLAGNAMTRTSHKLSFNRPGVPVEQIYAEHIATRDRIAQELGLTIVTPNGFETYQQRSNLEAQARRDLIRKTNPIAIALKVYWAKIKPLSKDWLGDYPKELEARTGQKFVSMET